MLYIDLTLCLECSLNYIDCLGNGDRKFLLLISKPKKWKIHQEKFLLLKKRHWSPKSERYAKIGKKHGFIPMPLGHYSYGLPLLVFIVVSLKKFWVIIKIVKTCWRPRKDITYVTDGFY